MNISQNQRFLAASKFAERFFHSGIYFALITAIGILGFVFKLEIYAIYIMVFFGALNWALCRDLLPSFLSLAIISMTPLARYGEVGYFIPNIFYVLIFIVPGIVLRLIFFPPKFRIGRFFAPTLAVAAAITLGGLFSIKPEDYFSMPSLYYTLALGVGMLAIYMFLESDISRKNKDIATQFAKMMVGVGIMGIAMIINNYVRYGEEINSKFYLFVGRLQWGNNLSNNLLLSMPFAFYLATKSRFSLVYFAIGVAEYAALVLSLSRGGMIFGSVMFPFVLAATFFTAKKNRLLFLIALAAMLAVFYFAAIKWMTPLVDSLKDFIAVSGDEARVNLYKLAWENFLRYPVFGTGLGFNGGAYYHPQPMAMYWYHSTIFQIVGSLGAVGLAAYGFQAFAQAKAVFRVRSKFNLFTALAIIGFAGYSMVNVGYFVPLPFVAMMTYMFVVADRHNDILLGNKGLLIKEQIILRQNPHKIIDKSPER